MKQSLKQQMAQLEHQLNKGQINRRDFLRSITLLGLSLGINELLAACGLKPSPAKGFKYSQYVYDLAPMTEVTEVPAATFTPAPEVTAIPPSTPPPRQLSWYCAACGARLLNLEALKRHAVTEHSWRLPEIKRVERPTYSQFVVGRVERFDERNTVFSRTMWDTAYQGLVRAAAAKAPTDDWAAMEGRALVAGAIYVDDTAGSFHPNYYGYNGHVRETGGLYGWDDPINPIKYPVSDPQAMSERIKEVARFYGANLVGITKVDPRWVYSRYFERATGKSGVLDMPYRYAIVMGIEMNWKMINTSPGLEASAATALAYSQMAELAGSLAKYIRALGYPAIPCGNDTAQSIPLAIDAGLGELGRNGLLISPEYGPRQRLCKVFTDLPLQPDQPIDFGMQSFCETCHACAQACPANAIQWGDRTTQITSISNRKGLLRWPVDVARCYLFWQENGCDCSNCVAACPWALHSQRDWLEI